MARRFRAKKTYRMSPTRKAYLAGVKAGKRTAYRRKSKSRSRRWN